MRLNCSQVRKRHRFTNFPNCFAHWRNPFVYFPNLPSAQMISPSAVLRDGDTSCYASTSLRPARVSSPFQESSPRCFGDCLPIPQVSLVQYIASKQAAMTPPQQPYQQVLNCFATPSLCRLSNLQYLQRFLLSDTTLHEL